MKRRDLWKLSLLNLFCAPVRSLLTVTGIAIGVGAVLAVLTLGEAGKAQVRGEMGRLGIDKVWLTAANGAAMSRVDAQHVSDRLQTRTAETVYLTLTAVSQSARQQAVIIGCTKSYLDMTDAALAKGRMLYPLEWGSQSRSVLVGESLAGMLCVEAGDRIFLEGRAFEVCGIVKASECFARTDLSAAVVVPLDVLERIAGGQVHEVMLDVPDDCEPQALAALARRVLADERGIAADTLTMQVQMDAADSVVTIFVDVLKWVAFICMLVGGIGVMNILLVSVRERTREIGIMKSLGATPQQICRLFLAEAVLYALIGGAAGLLTGQALIAAAGRSTGLNPQSNLRDCVIVFACAVAIGLVFGVLPAARAASLSCVDALREE